MKNKTNYLTIFKILLTIGLLLIAIFVFIDSVPVYAFSAEAASDPYSNDGRRIDEHEILAELF